jgi:VCBS repeat-containing protein
VAQPDAFTIFENGTITAGNLFANNGSGVDDDVDGPALSIAQVNGSALNVGTQIVLASGALLTVNANGTFDYDPGTAFLETPVAGSGASNTPGQDSFTYALANGNTVTVTITLTGLDTDDVMIGTAGADTLLSDGGQDDLFGLAGDDVYYIADASDVVHEVAGEGNDVVYVGASYALLAGSSVEVLSVNDLGGTDPINLTGNELSNLIYGNAGANVLIGNGGADYLAGNGGDDTYYVDSTDDYVDEAAGNGTDVVYTSASYKLAAGVSVEVLSANDLGALSALALTGNELGNIIYGNAGANVLNGGAGADYLAGNGGDDVYHVDTAGDYVEESAGQGNDVVYASASYTLTAGASVETLSTIDQADTAAINLTGNELGNLVYGNAGANVLNGGGGSDYLLGNGGADTFAFTTALGAGNVDTIGDFLAGTDKVGLDDAIFSGIGTPGAFNANAFRAGTAAADADDRIIYDQATGNLFYDADGNGAGAAVLFATIQGNPVLTASDFAVI